MTAPTADRLPRISAAAAPALALLLALSMVAACGPDDDEPTDRIHASTVSSEALRLYQEAVRLQDNLRRSEAHELFQRAVRADPEFALAHLGAAQTSPSGSALFAHVEHAIRLADLASEGEKHLIYAFAARVNSDPVAQERHARALAELHPEDERAHIELASLYLDRQEYDRAVEHYRRAIAIDPGFPPAYNQLGYLYRHTGDHQAAQRAFETYIELIPDEPNPYDSYGELLMKMGRFEESIEQYRKALERDPGFAPSQIGLGLNHILLEEAGAARAIFEALYDGARGDGERRQALTWLAHSYLFEERTDAALREVERRLALARAAGDSTSMAQDLAFMGRILLEAGRPDEAADQIAAAAAAMEQSDATAEVKQAMRHNRLYYEARIALARGDLAGSEAAAASYGREAERRSSPEQARAHRELLGRIALAREDWAAAVDHLSGADQQSPAVLYLLAIAHRGAGDLPQARDFAARAADWNALGESYPFVRTKARALGAELAEPAASGR